MATLRVAIDARQAKMGATEFNRATASMKTSAGSATMSIERGFSSAMRRILVFGSTAGAIYALKKFVDSASDAQETMNKFNVVFAENAQEVAKWSETFGDKVGRATQDVEKWLAGVQDLFVPLGFARDAATELSKSVVQLAVDVGSFNNVATADVIRDFNSAMVGNHETVRKYGIIISETALKQEALNQGLNKAYKDLTDLEKVQLRYSLIQKGTTDAQGDAVRSMNDYANQARRLKANLKEISTELGGPLMKNLTNILVEVNKNDEAWKSWIGTFGDGIEELIRLNETLDSLQTILSGPELQERLPARGWKGFTPPGMIANLYKVLQLRKQIKELEEGGLPAGELNISPKGYQAIEEMKARRSLIDEALNYTGAFPGTGYGTPSTPIGVFGPPEFTEAEKKQRLEDARDFAHKRADITARMYDDIGQLGTGYYESQKDLLEYEKQDYGEFVKDKALLDEWYSSKLAKISVESSGFWLEVRDATQAAQSALSDYFMELGNLDDLLTSTAKAFQRMFANLAAQMAMFGVMSALFSSPGALGFANPMANFGNAGFGGGWLFGGPKAPTYVPHRLGGVVGNGRVVPMASGMVLDGTTYFPMADGNIGKAGEAGPELGFFPLKRQGGKLGVEASGQQPVVVNPAPVRVIYVKNEREAMIEAMLSDEGQQAIVLANR